MSVSRNVINILLFSLKIKKMIIVHLLWTFPNETIMVKSHLVGLRSVTIVTNSTPSFWFCSRFLWSMDILSSEKQPSNRTGRLTDPLNWRLINSKRQVSQKYLAEVLNQCIKTHHARFCVGPPRHNPISKQAVG